MGAALPRPKKRAPRSGGASPLYGDVSGMSARVRASAQGRRHGNSLGRCSARARDGTGIGRWSARSRASAHGGQCGTGLARMGTRRARWLTPPAASGGAARGSRPGASQPARPASQPAIQPASQPASQPAIHPASQPAKPLEFHCMGDSFQRRNPSRKPAIQTVSQPASQPSSQPASQPASQIIVISLQGGQFPASSCDFAWLHVFFEKKKKACCICILGS